MKHKTCTLRRVASEQAVRDGEPGSCCFVDITEGEHTYRGVWIKFPHGECGRITLAPAPEHAPFVWQWNSSEKKPTMWREGRDGSKVGVRFHARWCGHIKAGRMVGDDFTPDELAALRGTQSPAAPMLPPPDPVASAVERATR